MALFLTTYRIELSVDFNRRTAKKSKCFWQTTKAALVTPTAVRHCGCEHLTSLSSLRTPSYVRGEFPQKRAFRRRCTPHLSSSRKSSRTRYQLWTNKLLHRQEDQLSPVNKVPQRIVAQSCPDFLLPRSVYHSRTRYSNTAARCSCHLHAGDSVCTTRSCTVETSHGRGRHV